MIKWKELWRDYSLHLPSLCFRLHLEIAYLSPWGTTSLSKGAMSGWQGCSAHQKCFLLISKIRIGFPFHCSPEHLIQRKEWPSKAKVPFGHFFWLNRKGHYYYPEERWCSGIPGQDRVISLKAIVSATFLFCLFIPQNNGHGLGPWQSHRYYSHTEI